VTAIQTMLNEESALMVWKRWSHVRHRVLLHTCGWV